MLPVGIIRKPCVLPPKPVQARSSSLPLAMTITKFTRDQTLLRFSITRAIHRWKC